MLTKNQALIALTAATLFTAVPACKDRSAVKPPAPAPNPTALSTAPRLPAAPEFVKTAKAIESAVMAANPILIDNYVDLDAIITKAIDGLSPPRGFKQSILSGSKTNGLGAILSNLRNSGCTYTLLRTFSQDGNTHAVFRLLHPEGGLNYHDWTLVKAPDGKIRAVDAFVAATGEPFSQTFRRLCVQIIAASDRGIMARLGGTDKAILEHGSDLTDMARDVREGRAQNALDTYDRLPASLKKEKLFAIQRIMAYGKLADTRQAEYEQAMTDYARDFAGDPSVDLISIDASYYKKDYAAFHRAADNLDKWTGGDPHLKSLRAAMIILEDKPDAPAVSEKLLREVVAEEPDLLDAHRLLMKSFSLQKKYADAVKEVQIVEKLQKVAFTDADLSELPGLTDSPEYKKFRAAKPR
jgi:hypothetical protein